MKANNFSATILEKKIDWTLSLSLSSIPFVLSLSVLFPLIPNRRRVFFLPTVTIRLIIGIF